MATLLEAGLLVVGLALGWLAGSRTTRNAINTELLLTQERLRASQTHATQFEERLRLELEALAARIATDNTEHVLQRAQERWMNEQQRMDQTLAMKASEMHVMIQPLKTELEKLVTLNHDLERHRSGAYEGIKRHLKQLEASTAALSGQTTALSTALTGSAQARGNWGEVTLRRLFELAGLTEHVDYQEQVKLENGTRPDALVRLPRLGTIPIDAKAVGAHFMHAMQMEEGPARAASLRQHARAARQRITSLSSKAYQEHVDGDFDHVVMFIPSEAMAAAAFAEDPDLMEHALAKRVLVATPVTLLGLLRTVALYWQQHDLAEGARDIYDVSRELYKRMTTMMDHFNDVGQHLGGAVRAFNATKASYTTRVLPQARRLDELKLSETLQSALPTGVDIEEFPTS